MEFSKYIVPIYCDDDIALLEDVLELSKQIRQKRWPYKKAKILADYKYREK